MGLPKIRKSYNKDYKYKVGRENKGWWSLTTSLWEAIVVWFSYL